jgi:hypothetical protein
MKLGQQTLNFPGHSDSGHMEKLVHSIARTNCVGVLSGELTWGQVVEGSSQISDTMSPT